MADSKLSYPSALVLQTISAGYKCGFGVREATDLPSGTVYPTLRRLEQQELRKSSWEMRQTAFADQQPARKYYKLTREGREVLGRSVQRYALLEEISGAGKSTRN